MVHTRCTCCPTIPTYPIRYPSLLTLFFFFFFNDPAPTALYTLSLHDALPICAQWRSSAAASTGSSRTESIVLGFVIRRDRKSTRLNSSHITISYAVFCLKKKK